MIQQLSYGKSSYKGEVTIDRYGRKISKRAHGTKNLDRQTASSLLLTKATIELYDNVERKVDRIELEKKLIDTEKPRMQSGIKDRVKSVEDMIEELTDFLNERNV